MRLNLPDLLNNYDRLFHVSEEAGITIFKPRPSPSLLPGITNDVIFAISGKLLHNYLLPRDCPRVTYYPSANTTPVDKAKFMGDSTAEFVVIVESGWYKRISETVLYVYEFPPDNFKLIDENAGYYISYIAVKPLVVHQLKDIITAMTGRNIDLRFTPSIGNIANAIKSSSMNYSLIRMQNAKA